MTRFQALIKGMQLYVPDEEGQLTAYQRDGNSSVGVFINVAPDDFEKYKTARPGYRDGPFCA